MAKNVNILDRAPTPLIAALYWTVGAFEDPTGLDRPLWRDYSANQGKVDHAVASLNGVFGMAARAGISWGYQDSWFPHNWQGAADYGMYRTSYHVPYPSEPVIAQLDNWYRVHPEIDIIPRVLDLELSTGVAARQIADFTWQMSEEIKRRDGLRPIIYSRYMLINAWLSPYWTADMLNDHFWWLAQYTWDRVREHAGPPTLPDKVHRDRVILHQTADKKSGFAGEAQSYAVDCDRWEIGNASQMHQWIDEVWGGGVTPEPEPAPGLHMRVIQNNLRVRNGPGLAYDITGYLAAGDIVTVADVAGDSAWVKVGVSEWANVQYGSDRNMEVV